MNKHEAGRELDYRIAVEVLGWQRRDTFADKDSKFPVVRFYAPGRRGEVYASKFSTEIEAAWQVVEHMRAQSYVMELSTGSGFYNVLFYRGPAMLASAYRKIPRTLGTTAPLAICLAALEVMQHDTDP